MKSLGTHWTADQDAELRRRHELGETARQICIGMGLYSRNQVIGRKHRLGLCTGFRRVAGSVLSVVTPTKARPDLAIVNRRRGPSKGIKTSAHLGHWLAGKTNPGARPGFMDDLSISVPCRRIPIEELVIGVCHWPLWGGDRKPYDFDAIRYCGCPAVKGLRYCAAHAARAYTPAGQKRINW